MSLAPVFSLTHCKFQRGNLKVSLLNIIASVCIAYHLLKHGIIYVTISVWCTFDHGLCSGWSQSSSDDFDWTLASGRTPSSSTGPATGQGGSGWMSSFVRLFLFHYLKLVVLTIID